MRTTYGGNSITAQTEPYGQFTQGQGTGLDPMLMKALQAKLGMAQQRHGQESALMDLQYQAGHDELVAARRARMSGRPYKADGSQPQKAPQGQMTFLKPMHGFNMSGGYARASAGDPGAVFAGYLPQGASLPQTAQMQGGYSFPGQPPTGGLQTLPSRVGGQSPQLEDNDTAYPNGTGAAFARQQMANALQRSNAEWEARQQQRGGK